jgi:AcrR family transcriptional regulator
MPDSSAARKTNLSRKPKQARSHQSLAKMLDTAKQMLAEQGYAEFTLQELSKRSNVSIGSIYHRFENKQELVRQVQAEVLEAIESKYAVLINHLRRQALPLQELMPSVVTLFGNHLKQHAPILRVFMSRAQNQSYRNQPEVPPAGHAGLPLLLLTVDEIHHRDAEHAVEVCFGHLFVADRTGPRQRVA